MTLRIKKCTLARHRRNRDTFNATKKTLILWNNVHQHDCHNTAVSFQTKMSRIILIPGRVQTELAIIVITTILAITTIIVVKFQLTVMGERALYQDSYMD